MAVSVLGVVSGLGRLHDPLDLDLSVYSTIGAHLGPGWLPYRDVFDHKQPLVYPVFWAIDMLSPRDPTGVRVAALAVVVLTGVLMLSLRRGIGRARAFAAAALLVVVASARAVEGGDLNTEHLLLLTAGAAVVVAITRWRSERWWLPLACGALLGVAGLTKAVGVLVAPAVIVPLLAGREARGQSALGTLLRVAAGAAAPGAVVLGIYAAAGGLGSFWYGNITYNSAYLEVTGSKPLAWWFYVPHPLRWLVAGAGVCAAVRLWLSRGRDVVTVACLLWLAGALVGAKMGRRDFPHYFAPVLAPAVILACLPLSVGAPSRRLARLASVALIAASTGPLVVQAFSDFRRPVKPFFSPAVIGDVLARRAAPGDRVFAAGSHTWIYATSGLRPASRYLYDLPRGIIDDFDRTIERELTTRPPRFVVVADGAIVPTYLEQLQVARYREVLRLHEFRVFELVAGAVLPEPAVSGAGGSAGAPGR